MNIRLQAIYDKVPSISCKKECGDLCTLIPVHPLEIAEIEKHLGRKVKTDSGLSIGYKEFRIIKPRAGSITCRFFRRNSCRIYEVRPLICRLYGTCEGMKCLKGCTPMHVLTDKQAHALINELEKLS